MDAESVTCGGQFEKEERFIIYRRKTRYFEIDREKNFLHYYNGEIGKSTVTDIKKINTS